MAKYVYYSDAYNLLLGPVDVGITVHVSSISAVSEVGYALIILVYLKRLRICKKELIIWFRLIWTSLWISTSDRLGTTRDWPLTRWISALRKSGL